jgi:hypothetical protein
MQKQWLLASLRQSDAPVKLIVSALPFVQGKNAAEDFRGITAEWEELLVAFADAGVSAILTADSHNYSRVELRVPATSGRVVSMMHYVVGTMGGLPQHNPRQSDLLPVSMAGIRAEQRGYYSGRMEGQREYYGYMTLRIDPASRQLHSALHRVGTGRDSQFELFDACTYPVPG